MMMKIIVQTNKLPLNLNLNKGLTAVIAVVKAEQSTYNTVHSEQRLGYLKMSGSAIDTELSSELVDMPMFDEESKWFLADYHETHVLPYSDAAVTKPCFGCHRATTMVFNRIYFGRSIASIWTCLPESVGRKLSRRTLITCHVFTTTSR